MKDDKIFNNRYNTGDLEYEVFGEIKLHEDSTPGDAYEEYIEQKIQEDIYNIFRASPYYSGESKPTKVSRSAVADIYYYFEERLPDSEDISATDKFTHIADFMGIQYEVLYDEISNVHKEKILRELDKKYAIFTKKKIKRLF
jgi:hypothetical protein